MVENTIMPFPKIESVIFDVDGLMINSEKIFTEVTNEILGKYGKEMTWEIKAACMGKAARPSAEILLSFFPDIDLQLDDYLALRDQLQDERLATVSLLPGVEKVVYHLKVNNIPMAIATGSRRQKYEMKTGHLRKVFDCFEGKVICGDDAGYNIRGKPAPDIFIIAAKELLYRNVGPVEGPLTEEQREERRKCLILEDAFPGVQGVKRAGMSVAWIADHKLLNLGLSGEERADLVLSTLEDFVPEQWGLPPYSV